MLTVLRHTRSLPLPAHTSQLRTWTGRSALAHLANVARPSAVMMPCYVPEGVIDPFRRYGRVIQFYRLNADRLTPDLADIEKCLKRFLPPVMVVVIHYFGYAVDTAPIRALCDAHEATLLEDCAHALFEPAPRADYVLYSLNKFLPVTDGAILLSRRADVSIRSQPPVPVDTMLAYRRHMEAIETVATGTDPERWPLDMVLAGEQYGRYYTDIAGDLTPRAQSAYSWAVEHAANYDQMRSQRLVNAVTVWAELGGWRPGVNDVPFAAPIQVENVDRVRASLMSAGIIPERLAHRWDHVPNSDPQFAVERRFIDSHLLLPIGEMIHESDVAEMCCKVRNAL